MPNARITADGVSHSFSNCSGVPIWRMPPDTSSIMRGIVDNLFVTGVPVIETNIFMNGCQRSTAFDN